MQRIHAILVFKQPSLSSQPFPYNHLYWNVNNELRCIAKYYLEDTFSRAFNEF